VGSRERREEIRPSANSPSAYLKTRVRKKNRVKAKTKRPLGKGSFPGA
jgi:hypothetical protein